MIIHQPSEILAVEKVGKRYDITTASGLISIYENQFTKAEPGIKVGYYLVSCVYKCRQKIKGTDWCHERNGNGIELRGREITGVFQNKFPPYNPVVKCNMQFYKILKRYQQGK